MRFMVIVKANKDSESGVLPSADMLANMLRFNEEMAKAGVMLAGEGLQASSSGARIKFSGSERTVTSGPFPETEQLVAGFWVIRTRSKDEAVEWMKRAPFEDGQVEIRQIFEAEDFGPAMTPEIKDLERRTREEIAAKP